MMFVNSTFLGTCVLRMLLCCCSTNAATTSEARFPTVLDTILGQVEDPARRGQQLMLPKLIRPHVSANSSGQVVDVLPSHFLLDATRLASLLRGEFSRTEFQREVVDKGLARLLRVWGGVGTPPAQQLNELKTAFTTVERKIVARIEALETEGEGLPLAISEKWKQENSREAEKRLEKRREAEIKERRLRKEREEECLLLTADKTLLTAVLAELLHWPPLGRGEQGVLVIRVEPAGGRRGVRREINGPEPRVLPVDVVTAVKDGWTELASSTEVGSVEASSVQPVGSHLGERGSSSSSGAGGEPSEEVSSERPPANTSSPHDVASKSRTKIRTLQMLKNHGLGGYRSEKKTGPVVFCPETIGVGMDHAGVDEPVLVNRDFVAGELEEIWRPALDGTVDGVRILRLDIRPVWLGWSAEDWVANQRREEVKAKAEAPDQQKMGGQNAGRVEEVDFSGTTTEDAEKYQEEFSHKRGVCT